MIQDDEECPKPKRNELLSLSLAALGVVFGDIGTSPLYSFRECFFGPHAIHATPANILGVLSLICWSLILVVSVKYLVFILRADNRGEGGTIALTALVTPLQAAAQRRPSILVALGLFGAALLYGDGMITPAISVLSAVEGLGIATSFFNPYVIPITIVILVGLFFLQHRGTAGIGAIFGPVLLVWFLVLAVLGVWQIVKAPGVLAAVNPFYGLQFLWHNGGHGFLVLGAVFLVVTGGEALYADMGHFGIPPIRMAWFWVVLPALLLNYFGQGVLLLGNPEAVTNPFFQMVPDWALYPMVILATAATVIASQAIISGTFSLTMQAIQLGYSPRLRIEHTSAEARGQIYLPFVNWALMLASIGLVVWFGSSGNLAAAYGIAVTTDMVITTVLFFFVVRWCWRWKMLTAVLLCGFFLVFDLAFLGANVLKIAYGGWMPLLVAGMIFALMSTWKKGRGILARQLVRDAKPVEDFLGDMERQLPVRVSGTAVFMAGNTFGTPLALLHNLKHNKVLHERIIILNVATVERPHVSKEERLQVTRLGLGIYCMVMKYGFMQKPNVAKVLSRVKEPGLTLNLDDTTFFLGRETLIIGEHPEMPLWRCRLFTWMSRNAQNATSFFALPPDRVIEVGIHVTL